MDIYTGFIVFIIVNIRSCLSIIVPLMFNQQRCSNISFPVDDDTSYYIYWFGEINPYLCTIQFEAERGHQICYTSKTFDIPHSMRDVCLEVRNAVYLKKFGSTDSEIKKKCVANSNRLDFLLDVNQPIMSQRPREYIKLKVYLSEKDDDDDHEKSEVGLILLVFAIVIVFGACLIVCCKKSGHLQPCCSRMNCQSNSCPCCIKMADCCIFIGTKWKSRLQNSNVVNDQNGDAQFVSIDNFPRPNPSPPPAYNEVVPEMAALSSVIQPPSYQDVTERRY